MMLLNPDFIGVTWRMLKNLNVQAIPDPFI